MKRSSPKVERPDMSGREAFMHPRRTAETNFTHGGLRGVGERSEPTRGRAAWRGERDRREHEPRSEGKRGKEGSRRNVSRANVKRARRAATGRVAAVIRTSATAGERAEACRKGRRQAGDDGGSKRGAPQGYANTYQARAGLAGHRTSGKTVSFGSPCRNAESRGRRQEKRTAFARVGRGVSVARGANYLEAAW